MKVIWSCDLNVRDSGLKVVVEYECFDDVCCALESSWLYTLDQAHTRKCQSVLHCWPRDRHRHTRHRMSKDPVKAVPQKSLCRHESRAINT